MAQHYATLVMYNMWWECRSGRHNIYFGQINLTIQHYSAVYEVHITMPWFWLLTVQYKLQLTTHITNA